MAYPYESVSRPRTRTDLHQRKGSSIYAKVVALEGLNPRWCGRQERDLEGRSGCDMSEKMFSVRYGIKSVAVNVRPSVAFQPWQEHEPAQAHQGRT